jgi:hypothetical protein
MSRMRSTKAFASSGLSAMETPAMAASRATAKPRHHTKLQFDAEPLHHVVDIWCRTSPPGEELIATSLAFRPR